MNWIIYLNLILLVDPVEKVTLASSNLSKSINYWNGILGLDIFNQTNNSVTVGFNKNEAKLELLDIGEYSECKTLSGYLYVQLRSTIFFFSLYTVETGKCLHK